MKDAYYFSHDANAKDDPKCVLLIEQLGLEGYGIFWVLIETLRDQPEYKYPLALIPALARRYNTTTQKVEAVVRSYGLFEIIDDEFFFSLSLNNRMSHLEYKRQLAVEAGKRSAEKRKQQQLLNSGSTDVQPTFNGRSTSKVKESKVKESIVNKNIYSDVPSELLEPLKDFEEMRKKIKAPMTDKARTMMLNNLNKLSNGDNQRAIEILNQSTMNCWKGLFPLKEDKKAVETPKSNTPNKFHNFEQREYGDLEEIGKKNTEKKLKMLRGE